MNELIRKINPNVWLAIYFIGLLLHLEILENIGVSLYLVISLQRYIITKRLSNFLVLLLSITLFCFIILLNISSDIKFPFIAIYISALIIISLFVRTKLSTKLHYNPKFWNQYSVILPLLVFLTTTCYFLSLSAFKPSFNGKFCYEKDQNIKIYYDNNKNLQDVKVIEKILTNLKLPFEDNSVKLIENEENYQLFMHVPKKWWDDEVCSELYYLYEDSLNRSDISKKLSIYYEVNTIFGEKIKQNDWIAQKSF